jgi:hypothetical protein
MDTAPASGAVEALRPTAVPRPWIRPLLLAGHERRPDHAPDDPAIRRYWTALIGPGAVADLLRLTSAALSGRALRRPLHLQVLLREGLVERNGSSFLVRRRVPALSEGQQRRLSPRLRAEYRRLLSSEA